jgi:clan AA aspartic protease
MGTTYAELTLSNSTNLDISPIKVRALVDTGALHLCIPQHVAIQLDLRELEDREVTLADGGRRLVPYVGPIEVRFDKRRCFVGAMIMGDETLPGAIPMEDMDLVIEPSRRIVTVNPASPNIPSSLAKSAD